MAALAPLFDAYGARMHPLGAGEGILLLTRHRRGDVTDSDPFYEELHPWLRVRPIQPEGASGAGTRGGRPCASWPAE